MGDEDEKSVCAVCTGMKPSLYIAVLDEGREDLREKYRSPDIYQVTLDGEIFLCAVHRDQLLKLVMPHKS